MEDWTLNLINEAVLAQSKQLAENWKIQSDVLPSQTLTTSLTTCFHYVESFLFKITVVLP
jgi:hypothetical protein